MSPEHPHPRAADPRIQRALTELQELIHRRYPLATFAVSEGDDPEGVYLTPTVDVEDTEEVFDVVVDRLLEMQIEDGLPVYVIPIRPVERVLEEMRARVGVRERARGRVTLAPEPTNSMRPRRPTPTARQRREPAGTPTTMAT